MRGRLAEVVAGVERALQLVCRPGPAATWAAVTKTTEARGTQRALPGLRCGSSSWWPALPRSATTNAQGWGLP